MEEIRQESQEMKNERGNDVSATRTISLWISNDEGLYATVQAMAEVSDSVEDLAQEIEDHFQQEKDDLSMPDYFSELLQDALNDVDWNEIAADFEEYIPAEVDEDDEESDDDEA